MLYDSTMLPFSVNVHPVQKLFSTLHILPWTNLITSSSYRKDIIGRMTKSGKHFIFFADFEENYYSNLLIFNQYSLDILSILL